MLRQLALAHEQRYRHFSVPGDLSIAITASKDALRLLSEDHSDYLSALCCLAQCIRTRFVCFGKGRDLQQAASIAQQCLERCPAGHPERADALENFVATLYAKHQVLKDLEDLDTILVMQEAILDLRPPGHVLRSQTLLDLSDTLLARFDAKGERDDLDTAISLLKARLNGNSSGGDSAVPLTQDYCEALYKRYNRFRDVEDLDLYISIRETLLEHFSRSSPSHLQHLRMLTSATHIRADKVQDVTSYTRAIELYEGLLQILPEDHQSRARLLADFGDALERYVKFFPDATDRENQIVRLREEVLALTPSDAPEYPSNIGVLAASLDLRAESQSNASDRDRAIALYRQALSFHPTNNDLRAECVIELANCLRRRYVEAGQREDLIEALGLFNDVASAPDLETDTRISLFIGLSGATLIRFRDIQFPTTAECDSLVASGEGALAICPESHPERAGVCAMFAEVLQNKFTLSWEPNYLDRAIPLYREAVVKFSPDDISNFVPCTLKLADALKVLYLLYYQLEVLHECIELLERMMQRVSERDRQRAQVLCGLSEALRLRYKHEGREDDVHSAIALARQALDSPARRNTDDRANALAAMGKALHARYRLLRNLQDLDGCTTYHEEVLELRGAHDPFRSEAIGDLGVVLMDRYSATGDTDDINRAIGLQRQAARTCPRTHPAYTQYLGNLIDLLFTRNRSSGDPGDLEEALVHSQTALSLRSQDRIEHLLQLSKHLSGLTMRYAQTSDPRDLEQMLRVRDKILEFDTKGRLSFSVDLLKKNAITLAGENTSSKEDTRLSRDKEGLEMYTSVEDRVHLLIITADTNAHRFKESMDLDAFNKAQETFREVLSMVPRGHEHHLLALGSLSDLLTSRFRQTQNLEYLDAAISYTETAVETTHPHTRAHSMEKSQLSRLLSLRYWGRTDPEGLEGLRLAIEHSKEVASTLETPLYVRFHAALYWAAIAAYHRFNDDSALDGYRRAFELLPQLAWLGSDTRASLHAIQQSTGVPADAATYALIKGHVEEAAEFLEAGRSIIWTQATRLRTPLGDVEFVAPDLAKRLKYLSRSLEGSTLPPISPSSPTSLTTVLQPNDTTIRTSWQLRQEWLSTIESIRHLPGFEHFLDKKPFQTLSSVAREGPVVLLIAHERLSVALILPEEGAEPVCIPLKTDVEKLKALHGTLKIVANSRGAKNPEQIDEDGEIESELERDGLRAGRVKRAVKTQSGATILSALWTDVVEPVVQFLTNMKRPTLADRKRLWWCTVGQFVFMPVHAAGNYETKEPISVSDFFISSYVPTLDALLEARKRPIPATTTVLAAIQPNAGKPWSTLPNTRAELREVKNIVPAEHLLHLSPTGNDPQGEEDGLYTTPSTILDLLASASVLHLACHGDQLPSNPLQSGFIMRDGERLTVEMLMKTTLKESCVALLSACHTAGNDPDRPDEAINLASVMLFVGFRSVGATMWPMGDPDGPVITRAVYKALFEDAGGDLRKFCLATALDGIVRQLRGKIPSERWATFIHIGA
ncbi:hypothetical protein EIP91_002513 [Steccherinum ochraceum]|uniref:CHAT domain-containing protein n=1 Tax=Steccherinum ochraceum TaxID=92696 RepID=A0A4R0RKI3_9APHY|nr:hypothetical protein EIP91_002513 [Steccherinum ochraceum]